MSEEKTRTVYLGYLDVVKQDIENRINLLKGDSEFVVKMQFAMKAEGMLEAIFTLNLITEAEYHDYAHRIHHTLMKSV